jgi:hypothetical protein
MGLTRYGGKMAKCIKAGLPDEQTSAAQIHAGSPYAKVAQAPIDALIRAVWL